MICTIQRRLNHEQAVEFAVALESSGTWNPRVPFPERVCPRCIRGWEDIPAGPSRLPTSHHPHAHHVGGRRALLALGVSRWHRLQCARSGLCLLCLLYPTPPGVDSYDWRPPSGGGRLVSVELASPSLDTSHVIDRTNQSGRIKNEMYPTISALSWKRGPRR
jgi:hypothetical protein